MSSHTINVGILAHVDAGKTSLTERLLFDHGAVPRLGSVDAGDTRTDSGEVERRRGITIRSAVASFAVGGLQINLVDTPGHPDFIAEVERALSVLDGAVLLISAVEGVQAQTRVLMRSLRRLGLPTLIFVNKIDRTGARHDGLLADIRRGLTPAVAPMTRVTGLGGPGALAVPRAPAGQPFPAEVAELLADHDDELLRRLIDGDGDGPGPTPGDLRRRLAEQTRQGLVHPLFWGSAMSGTGVAELVEGVRTLLPRPGARPGGDPRGTVFALERTGHGEKTALLRLFSGELRERERVTFRRRGPGGASEEYRGRVTGLEIIGADDGGRGRSGPLTAGNIARLRGLPGVRIGDRLGEPDGTEPRAHFAPPILESVVRPAEPGRERELHAALGELADEDPLIRTRTAGVTSVLLYGAVQREVIEERLLREFGVAAVFEKVRPVCFERPAGTGEAFVEFDPRGPNEWWQTVGVRVEPAPRGGGNVFVRDVEGGLLPRAYFQAVEDAVAATLRRGPYGWEVTDALVTLTRAGYEAPLTTAAHFRELTPILLMAALRRAGTTVHEPGLAVELGLPGDALSPVIGCLSALGGEPGAPVADGSRWSLPGSVPARRLQDLVAALPGLTHGEGTLWYAPGEDRRVRGPVPVRKD
ncbi:GTP-binding protein [Streptomyces sp. NPDC014894]|uniref:GTP-binding protein n=1 Tax=Streptomyces sp. NPDC014894 TaxID=3364931 RepID=UPI0036FEA312